jgi:FixJ family two-component response regulator
MVKFHTIQFNPETGKVYKKNLRVYDPRKGWYSLDMHQIRKPPENFCKLYEKRRKEFTERLNAEADETVQEAVTDIRRKPLTEKQKQVYELFKRGLKGTEVSEKLGKGNATVSAMKEAIRRKGYVI